MPAAEVELPGRQSHATTSGGLRSSPDVSPERCATGSRPSLGPGRRSRLGSHTASESFETNLQSFRSTFRASLEPGPGSAGTSHRHSADHTPLGDSGLEHLEATRRTLQDWVFWPLGEMVVLVLTVLVPVFIFIPGVFGYGSNRIYMPGGTRVKSFHLINAMHCLHNLYVLLRLVAFQSLATMLRDLVILAMIWVNYFVMRCRKMSSYYSPELCDHLPLLSDLDKCGWTRLLILGNVVVFTLYVRRIINTARALKHLSRTLASKKKRRYVDRRNGFDLDLSYITDSLVAMGWPTEDLVEQHYRNPMDEVQRFFATKHAGHFKVYNLCAERVYTDPNAFDEVYTGVRFPDHNPCQLADLETICTDMAQYQRQHQDNVVVVHCKAGKGRTGLVVCSFLLHTKRTHSADHAIEHFGKMRTFNGKGLTIPSQIRYVGHYEAVVREGRVREPRPLRLVRAEAWPKRSEDAARWQLQIATPDGDAVFSSALDGSAPVLQGDLKFVVFRENAYGKHEILFHTWLHTSYDPRWICARSTTMAALDSEAPAPWRSDVIWAEKGDGELGDGDGSSVLTVSLRNVDLDGLHKVKSHTERAARVDGMQEFRLLFVEACHSEASPCQRALRRSEVILEDYDHLDHDTDHEDLDSIICRGYLLRTKNMFATIGVGRPARRLCELDASGKLHIVGAHLLDALLVDVAEEGSRAVWEVPQTEGPGGPVAWKVKNPRTRVWETLQVEDRDHSRQWDESLHDAALLGDAARDSSTAFHGFFWCATQLPDCGSGQQRHSGGSSGSVSAPGSWRARLLVLRRDGLVWAYSHQAKTEIPVFGAAGAEFAVERLGMTNPLRPSDVVFRVPAAAVLDAGAPALPVTQLGVDEGPASFTMSAAPEVVDALCVAARGLDPDAQAPCRLSGDRRLRRGLTVRAAAGVVGRLGVARADAGRASTAPMAHCRTCPA